MKEGIFRTFQALPDAQLMRILADFNRQTDEARERDVPKTIDENDALASYWADFLVRFTGHSAAIEGSTLTLQQTALVLEDRFLPGSQKDLRDALSVRGIAEGYQWARDQMKAGRKIDVDFVLDIHERTALDVVLRARGVFRSAAVRILGTDVHTAEPFLIREYMNDLLYAYEHTNQPPLVAACCFHAVFETIHPFLDGNGRTGRILMNLMLEEHGYSPVVVKADDREAYLEALDRWTFGQIPADLVLMVVQSAQVELGLKKEMIAQTRKR